jgi:hypothetical protein
MESDFGDVFCIPVRKYSNETFLEIIPRREVKEKDGRVNLIKINLL